MRESGQMSALMSLRWSVSKLVLRKRQRLTVVHVLEESEAVGVHGGVRLD